LEVLQYTCGESELETISVESVKGGICLNYYFIGTALKAQRKFSYSPINDLTKQPKQIYSDLSISFSTSRTCIWPDLSGCRRGLLRID